MRKTIANKVLDEQAKKWLAKTHRFEGNAKRSRQAAITSGEA
jgi:hypothetical protein